MTELRLKHYDIFPRSGKDNKIFPVTGKSSKNIDKIFPDSEKDDKILIVLKECLKNNILPFIIEGSKKGFYYRGLSEWRHERNWLIDTCLDGQDTFKRLLDMLEIED